ncbi:MAG: 1-acyl-sn-glycerol-3-phosphate acyltransferase [Defluviitaleaceae bacterium]|nr:1-acyl-sn-glycerol-3-phosphate acyltransferase [Defluviitaleaceae bacterium]
MRIIRSIYFYFYFFISLAFLSSRFKRHVASKGKIAKVEYENLINQEVRWWAARMIKVSGAKINIIGEEHIPDESVVFYCNHQSYFDVAIFLGCIDKNKGFMSKEGIFKIPFLGGWMRELRCIVISQTDVRQALKAIIAGIEIIKDDYSMVIFPEGTRSPDGKLLEFKAGAFKLATKPQVPIIPVTIDGAINIMKKGEYLLNPATVNVIIHPPMYTNALTREEAVAIPEQVKTIIQSGFSKGGVQ